MSSSTQPPVRRVALRPQEASSPATPRTAAAAGTSSPLANLMQEIRGKRYRQSTGGMLGANFTSALEALRANSTRSFLTILGIFIGVAAVIAALTLTQGTSTYVSNQIASLGTSIIISPGVSQTSGASQGIGSSSTLTPQDAEALAGLPHIIAASPIIATSALVVFGNQNWTTQVEGASNSIQTIQNWQLAQGGWYSTNDEALGTPVAVLGDTVYHSLFDASGTNPLGQKIRIASQTFTVIGVLAPQGGGFSNDDVIFVPVKAAQVRLRNTTNVDQIMVAIDDASNVTTVAQAATTLLRQNHRLVNGEANDFTVFTFTQVLQRVGQTTQVLAFLLIGIAAISLTVGGIGIMNIMLVSVTERTWEIGIRMSVGARRRDIRNQFLIEALVLCLIGGVIGLALGLLIGLLVTRLASLPFVVTATTIIVPFAVATAIALVFGLYPAIRAAQLDPIVAIRTDE